MLIARLSAIYIAKYSTLVEKCSYQSNKKEWERERISYKHGITLWKVLRDQFGVHEILECLINARTQIKMKIKAKRIRQKLWSPPKYPAPSLPVSVLSLMSTWLVSGFWPMRYVQVGATLVIGEE